MTTLKTSIKIDGSKFVLYLPEESIEKTIIKKGRNYQKIPVKVDIDPNQGTISISKSAKSSANYFIYNAKGIYRIILKRYDIVPLWGESAEYPVGIHKSDYFVTIKHLKFKPPGAVAYYVTKHLLLNFEDKLKRMFSKYDSIKDTNRRRRKFIRRYNRRIRGKLDTSSKKALDESGGISESETDKLKEARYFELLNKKRRTY